MLFVDDAIAQHLAHPAMSGADPLTDSLYAQLEAPAAEGALAPMPYTASPDHAEHPGWWALAIVLLAVLAGGCLFPWSA